MPHLDGLQAAKMLRSKYGDQFKIFLLSANDMARTCDCVVENFDGFLTKPCSKFDLKQCLQSLRPLNVSDIISLKDPLH